MMDCYMKAIIMFCLLSLAAATPPSHQDTLIDLMRQCCTSHTSPSRRPALQPRGGKSGPVGRRGPPGIVNYTAIEEKIAAKYLDLEARNDENFGRLNGSIEARLEGGDAAIERIRNETAKSSKSIEENQKDLKTRFDKRFARLEKIIEAGLNRGGTEIEKLRNENTINSNSIEESQRDLETRFDERFARLERIIEAGLNRGDAEIEKLRNENTINSSSIEESQRAINSWMQAISSLMPAINSLIPSSCDEAAAMRNGNGGVMVIYRDGRIYEVYCDMVTDGGRWTVFQRRMDGTVDFYRDWEDYATGFGHKSGEFWLGLETVYQLTQDGAYELRVDLTDWDGSTAYAKYGTFSISGRSDNYRLTVGEYSGTAGDSLTHHNNYPFSAKNKDLDRWSGGSCATGIGAAWWFDHCGHSSLNGRYNGTSDKHAGVFWADWKGYRHSLKGSEMKFRKK